jgi:hypothetical protein
MPGMGDEELRISDADRERVAGLLNAAVGEGRITWAEHEERLGAVYAARTRGEIMPVLADLPVNLPAAPQPVPAVYETGEAPPVRVALSKIRRRPDPAQGPVRVDVLLGAAEIDLRGLPSGCVIDVHANSLLGKVEIRVSGDTRLVDSGTVSLGKRETTEAHIPRVVRRFFGGGEPAPLRSDSPVVRLSGHTMLGKVHVIVS